MRERRSSKKIETSTSERFTPFSESQRLWEQPRIPPFVLWQDDIEPMMEELKMSTAKQNGYLYDKMISALKNSLVSAK
jgi:hypothetical protein